MLAILFSVLSRSYALPCQSVVEVVPLLELRATPQQPPWLAGTFAYHAALISVVDACQLIGAYPCSRRLSSRVALVRCSLAEEGEVLIGVLAERMTTVRRLDGPPLVATDPLPVPYLGGVVKQGADLVQLVDVEGFVRFVRAPLQDTRRLNAGGALAPD